MYPRVVGGPPVNTSVCFLQGSRAWVSFVHIFGSRLAFVLVVPRGGGFVCPHFWFAFAVGIGRSVGRWFRFVRSLVPRVVLVDPVEIWPKSGKFAS